MSEKQKTGQNQNKQPGGLNRRGLIKALAASGGAAALSTMLPGSWLKPVVKVGVLPAHAQTSGSVGPVSRSYTTAGEYTLSIAAGVSSVTISAVGAKGGGRSFRVGGEGGSAEATFTGLAGQTLYIVVGSAGGDGQGSGVAGIAGTYGGGANGGAGTSTSYGGGAGGGGSSVATGNYYTSGGTLYIAGGGGGGTRSASGNEGGAGGSASTSTGYAVGQNGNGSGGGQGGQDSAGGNAGSAGAGDGNSNGTGGVGETVTGTSTAGGGGGAGGATGGGGGGQGGGGGGSSYVHSSGTSVNVTEGGNSSGDGSVTISWS